MEQQIQTTGLQFSPSIFDPNKEALEAIKASVKDITADPEKMTKEELELVNSTKNKLVKARTRIKEVGLAARAEANQYAKDVIAYEKELIGIIEPEELRLKGIEKEAKDIAVRKEREKTLPEFKEKLAAIGDGDTLEKSLMEKFNTVLPLSEKEYDDFLLSLDPNQRDVYYNERLGAHLEAKRIAAEEKEKAEAEAKAAEQKKLDEQKAEAERKIKEAELAVYNSRVQQLLSIGMVKATQGEFSGHYIYQHHASVSIENISNLENEEWNKLFNETEQFIQTVKKEEEKKAEEAKQAEIKAAKEEAEAKAKKEAEQAAAAAEEKRQAEADAAQKAKEEAEAKEKAELAARQSAEAFLKWQDDNSFNAETDTLIEDQDASGKVTILYREVSRYSHTS